MKDEIIDNINETLKKIIQRDLHNIVNENIEQLLKNYITYIEDIEITEDTAIGGEKCKDIRYKRLREPYLITVWY